MNWKFNEEEQEFKQIPVGDYRCRIDDVEQTQSQKGNDMLVVKLSISGQTQKIWHYVVFLDDRPEITNRNLTAIFRSFGIDMGDLNINNWKNKVGACHIKWDDEDKARIGYFIQKGSKAEQSLPAWQGTAEKAPELTPVDDDEQLPF